MKIHYQSVFDKWDMEDKSVQAIITSPPYYSLRKYNIPDIVIGAWQGQHGLEPSFKLYLEHCKLWMQEAIRVLRDDGVIFINLADSYASNGGASRHKGYNDPKYPNGRNGEFDEPTSYPQGDVKPKSKLLIPERFAIMCVDELGLILRNHIVWTAPNKMPESCQDRFSKKWESILMFVKSSNTLCWKHDKTNQWVWEKPEPDYYFVDGKRRNHWQGFDYYFDLDAIREPHAQVSLERLNRAVSNNNKWVNGADGQTKHNLSQPRPNKKELARDEAEIDIQSTGGQVSGKLYKDRVGSMQSKEFQGGDYLVGKLNPLGKNPGDCWSIPTMPSPERHFAMWPEKLVERMILCSTKAGDIVLDPFCGSGTTLRVADRLNRVGIGIELGYREIQEKLLSEIQKELILA